MLFYQQLYNRALEESYHLSATHQPACWLKQVQQVGIDDSALLQEFKHPGVVWDVAYSPVSNIVATCCEDGLVRLWNARGGRMIMALKGHESGISCVSFAPNGRFIVTGSFDKTVRVWDVLDGTQIQVLYGHTGTINDVIFHPQGRNIITVSNDETMRIWDISSGKALMVFAPQKGKFNRIGMFI